MASVEAKVKRLKPSFSPSLESNWAWLPADMLDIILNKINSFSDYARFASVCVHWRTIALQPHNTKNRLFPLLLLPYNNGMLNFYSVTDDQVLNFQSYITLTTTTRFIGSYSQWLIMVDDANLVITLFNPFSKFVISLPPLRRPNFTVVVQAVLSADPATADFVVAVILDNGNHFSFLQVKPDQQNYSWHYQSLKDRHSALDLIFDEGEIRFIDYKGYVQSWSLDNLSLPPKEIKSIPRIPKYYRSYISFSFTYLVRSSQGELWFVLRFQDVDSEDDLSSFIILKLNSNRWIEIESLGNDVLFLSTNSCTRASVSAFNKPNSIYYTPEPSWVFGEELNKFYWKHITTTFLPPSPCPRYKKKHKKNWLVRYVDADYEMPQRNSIWMFPRLETSYDHSNGRIVYTR